MGHWELEGFHYLFWWDYKWHKQMWFFKYCIIKCIITWKSCITLNQQFLNYQCTFHQFNCRTHLEPQSWYKDYFQLKTFKFQQMQEKASSELSLANSSNFWEIRLLYFLFRVDLLLEARTWIKPSPNTINESQGRNVYRVGNIVNNAVIIYVSVPI